MWERERDSMCAVGTYRLIRQSALCSSLIRTAVRRATAREEIVHPSLSRHALYSLPLFHPSLLTVGSQQRSFFLHFCVFKNSSPAPLFSSTIRCWALFESLSVHPQNGLTHKGELALENKHAHSMSNDDTSNKISLRYSTF